MNMNARSADGDVKLALMETHVMFVFLDTQSLNMENVSMNAQEKTTSKTQQLENAINVLKDAQDACLVQKRRDQSASIVLRHSSLLQITNVSDNAMKLVLLIKKDFVNLNVTTDGEEIKVLEKRMFVTDANLLTVRNASSEKEEGSELTMNNALIVMRTIT